MDTERKIEPVNGEPTRSIESDAIEKAIAAGDLSKLTVDERLAYYKDTCESLNLNWRTQPFGFIQFQGRWQLYAKRDCCEQLRKNNGISIIDMKEEQRGELLMFTAFARDARGRTDQSRGVVFIGGLKGHDLANKIMAAETKSKRRVTLSICGLGFPDETEIADLPGAQIIDERGRPQGPPVRATEEYGEPPRIEPSQVARPAATSPAVDVQRPEARIEQPGQPSAPREAPMAIEPTEVQNPDPAELESNCDKHGPYRGDACPDCEKERIGGATIDKEAAHRFAEACKKAGLTKTEVLNYLKKHGIDRLSDMRQAQFEAAMTWANEQGKF